MIKLSDGELLDLLPSQLSNDTDMICLSYAIKVVSEKLLADEADTMTMNLIDSLPDNILDILAVEWRTQYYDQSFPTDVKRDLVKNTFLWHMRAGTVSAVRELIETVFGEAELIEWWDFEEGERLPGYFDIITNAETTFDQLRKFITMIRMVKNVRSHLRNIVMHQELFQKTYIGTASYGYIVNPPIGQDFIIRWEDINQDSAISLGSYGYNVNPPISA